LCGLGVRYRYVAVAGPVHGVLKNYPGGVLRLRGGEPLFMLAKSLLPEVFVPSGVAGSIFLGFFCIYQLAKAQISPTFRSPKGTFQQSI